MRVLEKTIEIDATPDEVWDVLTDFADYEEWNPFVTSITGPAVAGARLAVVLAPPGGRSISMKPTVRAAEASRRLAWLGHLGVPGIFDGAHEFLIEPGADGTTVFTQRETFRGALVPFVGGVLDTTAAGFDLMNQALKDRVEGADLVAGHVLELGPLGQERELGGAGGPVAVLGHDDLGHAAIVGLRVVDLVAVDEHHDVGVLLDDRRTHGGRRASAACPGGTRAGG